MTVSVNSNKTVYEDLFPFLPATVKQVKYAQQPISYRYFLRALLLTVSWHFLPQHRRGLLGLVHKANPSFQ